MHTIRLVKDNIKVGFYLTFFCTLFGLLTGCQQKKSSVEINVKYEKNKAVGIHLPYYNKETNNLKVYLSPETETAVFGNFKRVGDSTIFKPVVPFTTGQTYELRENGKTSAYFTIAPINSSETVEILQLYPIQDTVPENLLKIYVQFSKPMQNVGNVLDFIDVYNDTEQKKETIFLPLETELWNREHDLLTLWLDPGRIKTDLIPNKKLGLPLKAGNNYTLTFSDYWKTANGQRLRKEFQKKWYVTTRDEEKPNVDNWRLNIPKFGTKELLTIFFDETLDYVLAQETIHVLDNNGSFVDGIWKMEESGQKIHFNPSITWKLGAYELQVDATLEDLAGNNLNRLFDENLENGNEDAKSETTYSIPFKVE